MSRPGCAETSRIGARPGLRWLDYAAVPWFPGRPDDTGAALVLEAIAVALDLDDLGVVQQAVEHGGCQHTVAGEGLVPGPRS